jgi:hypothetical protein
VTPEKIVGFLVGECLRGISSQTLRGRLAALRRYLLDNPGTPGASAATNAAASAVYTRTLGWLEKEFPGEVQRKNIFDDATLRKMRAFLDPFLRRGDLFALSTWSMLLLNCSLGCRNVHLRGRAFTWSQVTPLMMRDGTPTLAADLPYSKANRGRRDKQFDGVPVPRRSSDDRDLDAYLAFVRYASALGLTIDGTGSDAVFPSRHRLSGALKNAIEQDTPEHVQRADLRWILEQAGVPNVNGWGLHSPRRTAATRYLRLGVSPYTVMRQCGWASEKSLRIYDARLVDLAEEITAHEAGRTWAPAKAPRTRF